MIFTPRLPIAAITDEFSPTLAQALPFMQEIGMTAAELRVIDGKNILDLTDDELKRTREAIQAAGLKVISIASPVLKCVLPNAPAVDTRFQQDVFASKHTFADQPRLTEHAIKVARFFSAPILRVFSYWRTVQPERCHDAVVAALTNLAALGVKENVIIGLEVLWKEQIRALIDDGYRGYLSLETHWQGPNDNNKPEASRICGWNLRGLVT